MNGRARSASFCLALALAAPLAAARGTQLYWTDQATGQVARARLDGSSPQPVLQTFSPRGIAVDGARGCIFWAIDEPRVPIGPTGAIQRAGLLGEGATRVLNDLKNPWQVEYDPLGDWIYWSDLDDGTIRRVRPDGSQVQDVVTGLGMPTGLAVDSRGERLYWTELRKGPGEQNRIVSARLDGTDWLEHDVGTNIPLDVAVDALRGKVYWGFINPNIDGLFPGFLARANLDFSAEEPFLSGLGGPRALALDAAAGMLYWSDWNDVIASKAWIQRSSLAGGFPEKLVGELATPFGLALDLARLPGDANDDDVVDLADFSILKAHFGTGSLVTQGDFNESLSVDLDDFQILKAHFGETREVAAPEPAAWGLFAGGLILLLSISPWRSCPAKGIQ